MGFFASVGKGTMGRLRAAHEGLAFLGEATICSVTALVRPRQFRFADFLLAFQRATFDGLPISEIDRDVFTGSVSVIDQDITLFEDTVSQNIKMWDDSIEDFEVTLAARDAGIYDDIVTREGGFLHKLLDGGRDLSGGQRQRLEIARALSQDPTICIMDEATSALDARTEYEVIKSINARGITCIIIAHRLSTIRDCDEIIVLDKGKIVERGTHDELYAKGGYYADLVSNE